MNKWIYALALVSAVSTSAKAAECKFSPPSVVMHASVPAASQRLALAGPNRLELGLGQTPAILSHSNGVLIAKYGNGAILSSRQLSISAVRSEIDGALSLPDFIRLVFLGDAPAASSKDKLEAQAVRDGLSLECSQPTYSQLDNVDLFGYTQTRVSGDRYHGYYILDGNVVHYIDIRSTDAFAKHIISTLHKRN
ncbi:hypothetical protein IQ22_03666 [Pseudomonas duriflava]|uniref:Uncharacterized protein n=1 Tax=Pseudomonas duriflava TaxID=459528 RepID=A0A562Q4M0_9PSED|nr:hypothetical protein [Pseudomonas duriflava]TWI50966.1 hypothetical protein IQ22_03666 [Pseudomonas duriflava]